MCDGGSSTVRRTIRSLLAKASTRGDGEKNSFDVAIWSHAKYDPLPHKGSPCHSVRSKIIFRSFFTVPSIYHGGRDKLGFFFYLFVSSTPKSVSRVTTC